MIDSILTKLGDVSSRYEEIETLLSQPDITSNQEEYIKLSKEYSDLNEVINSAKKYISYEGDKLELQKILSEKNIEYIHT